MNAELADILEKAAHHRDNCEIVARGHYLASADLARRNLWLGIPVTVLSIIVGTAIFGTLQANPEPWIKISTGLLSISAALLSGLHTFLNYSEKSQQHKKNGAEYSSIRRLYEIFILRFSSNLADQRPIALDELKILTDLLTKAAHDSLAVPDAHWNQAYKEVHGVAA